MSSAIQQVSVAISYGGATDGRLFSPLESDDSRHDEALSSRIAALNMLDLSLDHLGLVTRPDDEPEAEKGLISRGLSEIVDRIGDGTFHPVAAAVKLTLRTTETFYFELLDAKGEG